MKKVEKLGQVSSGKYIAQRLAMANEHVTVTGSILSIRPFKQQMVKFFEAIWVTARPAAKKKKKMLRGKFFCERGEKFLGKIG